MNFRLKKSFLLFALIPLVVVYLTGCIYEERNIKDQLNDNIRGKVKRIADQNIYKFSHPYLKEAAELEKTDTYDSAIFYYKQALPKFKKDKNWEAYIWTLNKIANLYLNVAGYDFNKSHPFLIEAKLQGTKRLGNHPFVGYTYYFIGLYHYNLKEPKLAHSNLRKALKLQIEYFGELNKYVAKTYSAIADVYLYSEFEINAAELNYEKSLKIRENILAPDDPVIVNSYYSLINVNISKRDYEKASTYCFKTLEKLQYHKHKDLLLELVYDLMAKISIKRHRFVESINRLNYVIEFNSKSKGKKTNLTRYYINLGAVYNDTLQHTIAIKSYKKALSILNTFVDKDYALVSTANLGMAISYNYLNDRKTALLYLKKSLHNRSKVYGKMDHDTGELYQKIGDFYRDSGILDSSIFYYQKALGTVIDGYHETDIYSVPSIKFDDGSFFLLDLLIDKAHVLKMLYHQDTTQTNALLAALQYYHFIDKLLESHTYYSRENSKLDFAAYQSKICEEALDCIWLLHRLNPKEKYKAEAFLFIDKIKANMLLQGLKEGDAIKKMNPSSEFENTIGLEQNYVHLQSLLQEENSKRQPDQKILKILHIKLFEIERRKKKINEINTQNLSFYKQIKKTYELDDLVKYSKSNNKLIVNYFWGDSAVYILGLYKNSSVFLKVTSLQSLEKHINAYQSILAKGYQIASHYNDYVNFCNSAYAIYDQLLKATSKALCPTMQNMDLIVIPDGPLAKIPIESLLLQMPDMHTQREDYRQLNYLLRKFAVSYVYSAQFLLKEQKKNVSSRNKVLVFSYTSDRKKTGQSGNLNELRGDFEQDLPGSVKELKSIAKFMNGQFYMGDEATEQKFKTEATQYDILHLAIHGQADMNNPYNSKLIFKKGNDLKEDGNLYPYELNSVPIKAKLVVLSACESGIGKYYKGEGVHSVARGFVYAGCPCVLMSLWRVKDLETADLMERFYKELSTGERVDNSLRRAKINYLQHANSKSAHPGNWAAMISLGDTLPFIIQKNDPFYIFLVIGLVLCGISFLYLYITIKR